MSVNLVKGGKVNLSKEGSSTLNKVYVGLDWNPAEIPGVSFDLDASVYMLGANGKVRSSDDFIFYGLATSPGAPFASKCGSVQHTGDNLTGEGEGDDEVIKVDLTKVPADVMKLVFAVTIYDGEAKGQNFGQVSDSKITMKNDETGEQLSVFELDFDADTATGVVFGSMIRRGDDWYFAAEGTVAPGDLAGLNEKYGV